MKRLTFDTQLDQGFCLNLTDLILLATLTIISLVIYTYATERYIFLLPLYVSVTFFLFCNIFSLGNRLDPFWYVPFTITVIYGFILWKISGLWFYGFANL